MSCFLTLCSKGGALIHNPLHPNLQRVGEELNNNVSHNFPPIWHTGELNP